MHISILLHAKKVESVCCLVPARCKTHRDQWFHRFLRKTHLEWREPQGSQQVIVVHRRLDVQQFKNKYTYFIFLKLEIESFFSSSPVAAFTKRREREEKLDLPAIAAFLSRPLGFHVHIHFINSCFQLPTRVRFINRLTPCDGENTIKPSDDIMFCGIFIVKGR